MPWEHRLRPNVYPKQAPDFLADEICRVLTLEGVLFPLLPAWLTLLSVPSSCSSLCPCYTRPPPLSPRLLASLPLPPPLPRLFTPLALWASEMKVKHLVSIYPHCLTEAQPTRFPVHKSLLIWSTLRTTLGTVYSEYLLF